METGSFLPICTGAVVERTSINHVCETTDDSFHANTIRSLLTDQFDVDTVEEVGDILPRGESLEQLPNGPVDVVADFHLRPYYGDEEDTNVL